MAKKWIVILLVACIGLGGGLVYIRQESDRQAPEIEVVLIRQKMNMIRP